MIHIFIIGNGFDLAHGYKTRYSDFMLDYINKIELRLFNQGFYQDKDNLLDFKLNQGAPTVTFNTIEEFSKYYFSNHISKNPRQFRPNFFETHLLKEFSLNNWIDIELEYFKYLKKISDIRFKSDVVDLHTELVILKTKLIEYLDQEIRKNSGDIINYSSEFYSNLESWLFEGDYCTSNDTYVFLNFNYTNTIQRYISNLKTNHTINPILINIHGLIKNNIDEIIFGYGDEIDEDYQKLEKLNANVFLDNIKSFAYLKSDNYKKFFDILNNKPFEDYWVHILGHSCGISDRILLKNLFDNKRCKTIQIHFHIRDDGTDDFFEKTQDISRHFDHNGKHEMRIRILPKTKCQPLLIREN